MNIDFTPCLAQTRAFRAFRPHRTVTNAWGRGIGKSWFMRVAGWYLPVARWDGQLTTLDGAELGLTEPRPSHLPGVRIIHVMPTLEQSKRVHAALLAAELGGDWSAIGGHLNRNDWRVTFPGGSYIQWITSERAQHQRGIRADIVTADEADDIDEAVYDAIVRPFFSEPFSLGMALLGGTPRKGRKGLLWKMFSELPKKNPAKYSGFHATAYDAPRLVRPDVVREAEEATPEAIFKREWLCDFDAAEGLVYPMFRETFHVREPDPDVVWSEVVIVADHGFEDPGVILVLGILGHGRDATAWVIDEVYEQHREPEWWLAKVRERVGWFPQAKWYADPARPDTNASWKRAGARIQEFDKGIVEDGVTVVQRWLHIRTKERDDGTTREWARFYVRESCKHTIHEFGSYRRKRDPRNPEATLEAIEDRNNHAMDAIRYGLVGRFEPAAARAGLAHAEQRQ